MHAGLTISVSRQTRADYTETCRETRQIVLCLREACEKIKSEHKAKLQTLALSGL
jgi:hypothetical protein